MKDRIFIKKADFFWKETHKANLKWFLSNIFRYQMFTPISTKCVQMIVEFYWYIFTKIWAYTLKKCRVKFKNIQIYNLWNLLDFFRRWPALIPKQTMWDLCWTKWHWNMFFFPSIQILHLQYHFTKAV